MVLYASATEKSPVFEVGVVHERNNHLALLIENHPSRQKLDFMKGLLKEKKRTRYSCVNLMYMHLLQSSTSVKPSYSME